MHRFHTALCFTLVSATLAAQAPQMTKIDPPNWWVNMPAPMLLIEGDHLTGAKFTLSGHARIERTKISANGHYAELWLSEPATPETLTITAVNADGHATLPFRFDPRHKPTDGFAGFSGKDVLYLIMTDRFADGDPTNDDPATERAKPRGWHGGDLRGVLNHLDYLQNLGITTVWITPAYQNHEPQSYHGYGATDLYAVDEHFGSLDDLKALSNALHKRNMKLVLDMVPNHIGPAHPWVEDEPDPDWFHGTKAHHDKAQGEFKPITDPHAPWRDQKDVTEGWFADLLPDMNQENPAVAQYLTQNAIWWTEETATDGIRLDTFPYIKRSFYTGFHAQLFSLWPHLTDVGEVFNGDPTIVSAFAGGVTRDGADTGLYTPFDFPTYFALRDVFLKGQSFTRLEEQWRMDPLYPHPERLVPFLGNHDTPRFLSEPGATPRQLQLAFAVLLTMRGTPQLYSGDEIAMQGGDDPDNRRDFPGGFPGDLQSAFSANTRTPAQQELYDWVHTLLQIRKAHTALQDGDQQVLKADETRLVYTRTDSHEQLVLAVNNSEEPVDIQVPLQDTAMGNARDAHLLFGKGQIGIEARTMTIHLPARGATLSAIH